MAPLASGHRSTARERRRPQHCAVLTAEDGSATHPGSGDLPSVAADGTHRGSDLTQDRSEPPRGYPFPSSPSARRS